MWCEHPARRAREQSRHHITRTTQKYMKLVVCEECPVCVLVDVRASASHGARAESQGDDDDIHTRVWYVVADDVCG